ncbi:hypothetical protein JW766_01395 [Candidatus Dojkabacteria bacterium]|nr:hypothetical protein [Candidatus Dojkabacteria bacterium]
MQEPDTSTTPPQGLPQEQALTQQQPVQEKKSNKVLIIAVLVFTSLLSCGIGVGVYWFLTKDKQAEPEQKKTCSYNDTTYNDGDTFDADDGCNQCLCNDGEVTCTLMACEKEEAVEETIEPIESWETFKSVLGYEFKYPSKWSIDTSQALKSTDDFQTGESETIIVTSPEGYAFKIMNTYETYLYRTACYFEGVDEPKLGEDPPAPYYKTGNFPYYYNNMLTLKDTKTFEYGGENVVRGYVESIESAYGGYTLDPNTLVVCEKDKDYNFYLHTIGGLIVNYTSPTDKPSEDILSVLDRITQTVKKQDDYMGT